jgi:hypothetical protein
LSQIGSLSGSSRCLGGFWMGWILRNARSIQPDEQDRQKLSRFGYEDIRKFSPLCVPWVGYTENFLLRIVKPLDPG